MLLTFNSELKWTGFRDREALILRSACHLVAQSWINLRTRYQRPWPYRLLQSFWMASCSMGHMMPWISPNFIHPWHRPHISNPSPWTLHLHHHSTWTLLNRKGPLITSEVVCVLYHSELYLRIDSWNRLLAHSIFQWILLDNLTQRDRPSFLIQPAFPRRMVSYPIYHRAQGITSQDFLFLEQNRCVEVVLMFFLCRIQVFLFYHWVHARPPVTIRLHV